jgi:hypothetical protein
MLKMVKMEEQEVEKEEEGKQKATVKLDRNCRESQPGGMV